MAAKNKTFAVDDPDLGGRTRYISFAPENNHPQTGVKNVPGQDPRVAGVKNAGIPGGQALCGYTVVIILWRHVL